MTLLSPEAATIAAAAAIVFAAALISSIAGFAFSALAGAALLRVFGDPVQTVGVMVICSIAIQSYSVWSLRRALAWRDLWPFLLGGALTVPLGVWLLAVISPFMFSLGLGLFVTAYGVYMMCRRELPVVRAGRLSDTVVGMMGGLSGGLAALPGYLVTIWCAMRGWPAQRQRGLYQPFILIMQLEALAFLDALAPARITPEAFLVYAPAALVAAHGGLRIFRRLTGRQFSHAVQALLIVSGVALLAGAAQPS